MVVVAGMGLMSFALFQNPRAFPGEHGADRRQAFICAAFGLMRGDNITECPDQTVRPFLVLEVMQCQSFLSAAMDAHHPFDEHLTEIITDPRQLGLKKHCRKRVAFVRLQLQHSRGIMDDGRKLTVQAVREFYFEEGELMMPATFNDTGEERKSGFRRLRLVLARRP